MYRQEEFREWFARTGKTASTVATHISTLNGVDNAFNIDAKLKELGTDGFLEWSRAESSGPFSKYPAHARSVLKRYVEFTIDTSTPDDLPEALEVESSDVSHQPLLFQVEKEMQAAVRRQLDELERGLVAIDEGREVSVATGKIDILAKGVDGKTVVIELKAGLCPSGALEQVLGYADAVAEEYGGDVRAYLVAGAFSDRTRAAARRTRDLELRSYRFSVQFDNVEK